MTTAAYAREQSIDELIAQMSAAEAFDAYDLAFARLAARLDPRAPPAVLATAALASSALRAGDVCIALDELAEQPLFDGGPTAPRVDAWRDALRASPLVGVPGARAPLILDAANRLYLHRYFDYEVRLAGELNARLATRFQAPDRDRVDRWFGVAGDPLQRAAALAACTRGFSVIAGGPGTGKTTTVARILGLLIELHGPAFRVHVAAPTGKAAARLQRALGEAWSGVGLQGGPPTAQTVHRLLGTRADAVSFRHDADKPLGTDCVIVDEASMLDVALACKLVAAVPPHARLILLGDPDQLSSVEAGAVMASLAGTVTSTTSSASVTRLERSYRFAAEGGIAQLASTIRAGRAPELPNRIDPTRAAIASRVESGYAGYIAAVRAYRAAPGSGRSAPIASVFEHFNAFRVLAASRHGRLGVYALNRVAETIVRDAVGGAGEWYPGRAVMVTANDYGLELFNGDVGIALPEVMKDDTDASTMAVRFERADGTYARVPIGHLPEHEPAFVMTVHKSQGSEFREVLVCLPPAPNRALSRELLYTAVTRATETVTLAASEESIAQAITIRRVRRSGLADRLAEQLGGAS